LSPYLHKGDAAPAPQIAEAGGAGTMLRDIFGGQR
jgi:hypothetical protein